MSIASYQQCHTSAQERVSIDSLYSVSKIELQALQQHGKGKFVQPELEFLVHVVNHRSLHSTTAFFKDWLACMSKQLYLLCRVGFVCDYLRTIWWKSSTYTVMLTLDLN